MYGQAYDPNNYPSAPGTKSKSSDLSFDLPLLLITLGVGAVTWLIGTLIYRSSLAGSANPLAIGLIFGLLCLPLLAVDSIVLARTEIPGRESLWDSLKNGILTTVGFAVAACLIGTIREIFSSGTVLGQPITGFVWTIPITGLACGGFIVTALLAAAWQGIVNYFKKIAYRRRALWK